MNVNVNLFYRAMELAVKAAGHSFPQLSKLATGEAAAAYPRRVAADTTGYAIVMADVTMTPDREIRLIEANGSNAALSSAVTSGNDARAKHMFLAYSSKPRPAGPHVAVLAYQPHFLHICEFFARAALFTSFIAEQQPVALLSPNDEPGKEVVTVACGSIPDLADHITRNGDWLLYRGRPVAFGANSNLLAELARRSIIRYGNARYDIDVAFYHEGRIATLVHDKAAQQDVAAGTGIVPLRYDLAWSLEECRRVISRFHEQGMTSVGKMNAGSGGTGIQFFPPTLSAHQTEARLQALVDSAAEKYGDEIGKTIFPIRCFEFARSTDYDVCGKPHLWDLRVQCLIYPGYVEVTPCVVRLCPAPFNEVTFDMRGVLSNLSGRAPTLRYMRSPFAMRRSRACSVLESVGIDTNMLARIVESSARWCEAAWRYAYTG